MVEESERLLREISRKLDDLVVLLKISNRDSLDGFRAEIGRDHVAAKILEKADGTMAYSDLSQAVARDMKVAEITVKRKIATLREMGVLVARREGREVYYEDSGLLG